MMKPLCGLLAIGNDISVRQWVSPQFVQVK
jgi:hypothetical protein